VSGAPAGSYLTLAFDFTRKDFQCDDCLADASFSLSGASFTRQLVSGQPWYYPLSLVPNSSFAWRAAYTTPLSGDGVLEYTARVDALGANEAGRSFITAHLQSIAVVDASGNSITGASAVSVPEPSMAILLLLVVFCLCFFGKFWRAISRL
jgi:hypothetical protein